MVKRIAAHTLYEIGKLNVKNSYEKLCCTTEKEETDLRVINLL